MSLFVYCVYIFVWYDEYSGRFYTPIPEIGNRSSDVKETALPF